MAAERKPPPPRSSSPNTRRCSRGATSAARCRYLGSSSPAQQPLPTAPAVGPRRQRRARRPGPSLMRRLRPRLSPLLAAPGEELVLPAVAGAKANDPAVRVAEPAPPTSRARLDEATVCWLQGFMPATSPGTILPPPAMNEQGRSSATAALMWIFGGKYTVQR